MRVALSSGRQVEGQVMIVALSSGSYLRVSANDSGSVQWPDRVGCCSYPEDGSRTCLQNVDFYCECGDKRRPDEQPYMLCSLQFLRNVQLYSIWVCVFAYADDAVIFHFLFYFCDLKFKIMHLEGKRHVGMHTNLMLLLF